MEALRPTLPLPPPPPCITPSAWCFYEQYLPFIAPEGTHVHHTLAHFRQQHLPTLLADIAFAGVPPSLLAAATMVCARRSASLAPEWPQGLAGVTGLTLLPSSAGSGVSSVAARAEADTGKVAAQSPLQRLAGQVATALGLPQFQPSAYQHAIAEGLDGMLRMDHRPSRLASTVLPECAAKLFLQHQFC